jgi:hypothetical protein
MTALAAIGAAALAGYLGWRWGQLAAYQDVQTLVEAGSLMETEDFIEAQRLAAEGGWQ